MLKLSIEFEDPDDELTGYNMGHITFQGDLGTVSSKNKTPSQAMMVLISFLGLFYGLRKLYSTNDRQFEFIGVDSSFTIYFDKLEDGLLNVHSRSQEIERAKVKEIYTSIYRDVSAFLVNVLPKLPEDDIAYDDLGQSMLEFKKVLDEL